LRHHTRGQPTTQQAPSFRATKGTKPCDCNGVLHQVARGLHHPQPRCINGDGCPGELLPL
jgi:hypothetical protein